MRLAPNFIVPYIIVPLFVLTIYSFLYVYFSVRYLGLCVNSVFATKLFNILFVALVIFIVIYPLIYLIFIHIKSKEIQLTHTISRVTGNDLILLLLPLAPVLQYLINNSENVSFVPSLLVIAFFLLCSTLFIFLIPALFGFIGSTRVLIPGAAVFTFSLTSMSSLSRQFDWSIAGEFFIQFLFFIAVFFVVLMLFNLHTKKALSLFVLANIAFSSLSPILSNGITKIYPKNSSSYEENQLFTQVNGRHQPDFKPNIYLLVFEAYVPNETMLSYGIDNHTQEDYLEDKGFRLYPATYSVGSPTLESMSRVFNVSTEFYGDQRRAIAGDGVVQNIVKQYGYVTYGVFPHYYMFRGFGSRYDYSFPDLKERNFSSEEIMIISILMGEFDPILEAEKVTYDQYIQAKHNSLNDSVENLVFLYSHSYFPGHAEPTGSCRPNEIEIYQKFLSNANEEMSQDIEQILSNDPHALIIIAGDHGPYLTKTCFRTPEDYGISEITRLDIQDRFGTFLAIRWPTDDFEPYDEITVLQDVFPAVFAYLYQDTSILDSRIEPEIISTERISGATVKDGIIYGGVDDGEPLFLVNSSK